MLLLNSCLIDILYQNTILPVYIANQLAFWYIFLMDIDLCRMTKKFCAYYYIYDANENSIITYV